MMKAETVAEREMVSSARRTSGLLRCRTSKMIASMEGKESRSREMGGKWWKVMEGTVAEMWRM